MEPLQARILLHTSPSFGRDKHKKKKKKKKKITFLFAGAFIALIGIPAAVVPSLYFRKYRVVALGLVTAPGGVAAMCTPPMLTQLIEEYGWRDANMAVAAICIQVCYELINNFHFQFGQEF